MTKATKNVMKMVLRDFIRVTTDENALYTAEDIINCYNKIQSIDFMQVMLFFLF